MGKNVNQAAIDSSVTAYDSVTRDSLSRHPEIGTAMLDKLVHLLESSLIEEEVNSFSRGEFGGVVLAFASFGSTPFS